MIRGVTVALLTFGLVAAVVPAARGANFLEVRAEMDRREMGIGETALLTLTVIAEGVDVPPAELPPISGADVKRQGESQGLSWVNGRVIRTLTIAFRVTAKEEGTVTIPAVRVESQGMVAESKPLILHVGKSPPPVQGGTPELFARLSLDKRRAYWNENVTARFTIYSRIHLEGAPVWDPPDAPGFWTEVLGPQRTQRVTIAGVVYDATELRVAYFPTRTGRLVIGPGRVHLRVVRRVVAPDPWSAIGLPETQVEEGILVTEQGEVEVLPLPPGAPGSFKGAVGSYEMDVRVDRSTVGAGEPVTVVTVLRGEGNLGSAGDPEVAASLPARSYAAGPSTALDRSGNRLRGQRRREVTFVPEAPGRFAIFPVRFSWFDPEDRRYRTQVSDTIRVLVRASDAAVDSLRPATPTGPVAALRSRPGRRGRLTLEPPAASGAIAIVSLIAYAGALVGRRVRDRLERDPKRRRAAGLASLLDELLAAGGARDAAGPSAIRIGALVRRALGLRYDVDVEGRPVDEALGRARAAGAPADDVAEVARILHALDHLAFAPPGSAEGEGHSSREAAERLLRRYREELA